MNRGLCGIFQNEKYLTATRSVGRRSKIAGDRIVNGRFIFRNLICGGREADTLGSASPPLGRVAIDRTLRSSNRLEEIS